MEVLKRETQEADYWLKKFSVESEDIEYIYELFLEKERPLTLDELTLALIERRCRQEEERLKAQLAGGVIYQPKASYEVGQRIFFPVFDFAPATVVGIRPGYNPDYGSFQVIQVRFEGQEDIREFAAELPKPHKLDMESEDDWLRKGALSPSQLFELYGQQVKEKLRERLAADDEFISFNSLWFVKGMLAEVHVGHLNIAEAAIEVANRPLSAEEILPSLELPDTINRDAQVFSLNYALQNDERFDRVGPKGTILWYLKRLEPPEAVHPPRRLLYSPEPYEADLLTQELLEIVQGIDDEATDPELLEPAAPDSEEVTIVLPYPHRRVGTLPLTPKTAVIFPEGDSNLTIVTFIDSRKGEKMPGWVVHDGKYVLGLSEWYEKRAIPVGAYITLRRGANPLEVVIEYKPRRLKKEWVRAAKVQNERLIFEMQMRQVGCDYDELMMVADENPVKTDALWLKMEEAKKPLYELLMEIFPELAKLSPQGTVHSRTLYTAVNLVKRCPPAPILTELAKRPCFIYVGNGYWVFDESKL